MPSVASMPTGQASKPLRELALYLGVLEMRTVDYQGTADTMLLAASQVMKPLTRRIVGVALIAVASIAGVLIQIFGTDVFSVRHEGTPLSTKFEFGFHWSAVVLAVIALIGLFCLVLPRRRHGNDQQSSVLKR